VLLSEAFIDLSLDLSAQQLSEKFMEMIEQGRIDHEYAYDRVENSHFSVENSLKELSDVYGIDDGT
jgi:hypothetical protein